MCGRVCQNTHPIHIPAGISNGREEDKGFGSGFGPSLIIFKTVDIVSSAK